MEVVPEPIPLPYGMICVDEGCENDEEKVEPVTLILSDFMPTLTTMVTASVDLEILLFLS